MSLAYYRAQKSYYQGLRSYLNNKQSKIGSLVNQYDSYDIGSVSEDDLEMFGRPFNTFVDHAAITNSFTREVIRKHRVGLARLAETIQATSAVIAMYERLIQEELEARRERAEARKAAKK
ncbi:MAG: hypothetical protein FWH40_06590 [Coriobacteriia bacterium]|nr:hypothetical protein [Coriobacteriia bacterium]